MTPEHPSNDDMQTEHVLEWLEQVRKMLPGSHPTLLRAQFARVQNHVAQLENEKRMNFAFATTDELFHEIARRYSHALMIGAIKPDESGDERYYKLHSGDASACIGLAGIAADMMRGKVFRVDPNDLQGGTIV